MEFSQRYVVLLKKGANWSGEQTPESAILQERHLAHLSGMFEAGKMNVAGPVTLHFEGDIRGLSIFPVDGFESLEALKVLVEQDPAIESGQLRADYMTWYFPEDITML